LPRAGIDARDKAVTAARNGLDKARSISRVAQSFPQPLRGIVQTLFEVNKRIRGPDPLLQFLACDDLTGMLQQHLQEEEWLFLKFDLDTLSSQLSGTLVNLKEPETNQARPGSTGCVHAREHPVEEGVYHDLKKTGAGQVCVIDDTEERRDSSMNLTLAVR